MSRSYSLSDLADQDILDIAVYLAQFGVNVADRMIDKLHKKFDLLLDHPTLGRPRDELRSGLRSLAVDRYVVFTFHSMTEFESSGYCMEAATSKTNSANGGTHGLDEARTQEKVLTTIEIEQRI